MQVPSADSGIAPPFMVEPKSTAMLRCRIDELASGTSCVARLDAHSPPCVPTGR